MSINNQLIKALPIRNDDHQAVLDTKHVINLKVVSYTKMIGGRVPFMKLPEVGSIVKVRTRHGLMSLIVVDNHSKIGLGNASDVKPIFAYSHEFLMEPSLVKTYQNFMKVNHLSGPQLQNQLIAVTGYHCGFKGGKPYVNTTKAYQFRVTNLTRHFEWMAKNRTASVMTQRGKAFLVIYKIDKMASNADNLKLKPVLCFHNFGIRNPWIANIYRRKVLNHSDSDSNSASKP